MKKTLLLLAAMFAIAGYSQAQTTNASSFFGDLGTFAENTYNYAAQAIPYLTNGEATVIGGFGENTSKATQKSSGKWVEIMGVTVPVSTHVSIGVGGLHQGSAWNEGSISAVLQTTNSVEYLGQIVGGVASGPAYDFKTRQYTAYSFAFAEKNIDLYQNRLFLKLGVLTGDVADRSGADILGYGAFNFSW